MDGGRDSDSNKGFDKNVREKNHDSAENADNTPTTSILEGPVRIRKTRTRGLRRASAASNPSFTRALATRVRTRSLRQPAASEASSSTPSPPEEKIYTGRVPLAPRNGPVRYDPLGRAGRQKKIKEWVGEEEVGSAGVFDFSALSQSLAGSKDPLSSFFSSPYKPASPSFHPLNALKEPVPVPVTVFFHPGAVTNEEAFANNPNPSSSVSATRSNAYAAAHLQSMMAARNVTIAPSARGDAVRIVRPPTPRPARVDPEGLSLEEQAHALLASIEARVGIPAYTHATFGDSASMSMDPDPAPAPAPSYATNTSRFDRFARESNPWAIAATTDHSLNAPSNLLSDATVAPRPFQRHNAFIGSRSPPASPVPAQSLLSRIAPARTSAFGNPTPTPTSAFTTYPSAFGNPASTSASVNQEPAPSHTANAFDRYAQQSNPWAVPSGGAFGEPTPAPEPAPPTFGYTSAIFGDSASASVPLETATPAFAPFATPAPAEGQHQPYQTQQYYAPQQEFSQQSYAQGHGHYFDQSQQQQQQQMHFPPQEMPSVFQPEYTMPQPHQYTSHEPQFLAPPVLSPEQLAYLAAQCTSPADLVELLEHARQLGYLQAEVYVPPDQHEYVAALQVLQAHQEYWYQQQCLDQQQGVYQQHEQHETHAPAPSLLFGPAGCPPRRVVVEVECGLTEEELGVEAPAQPEWWAGVAAAQEWHEASDNSGLSYHIESEEEEGDVDVEMDLEENGDYIEEAYVRGQDAEERRAMARVGQAIQANWRNNYMGRPPVRRRTALQERATSSALASFSGQVASTSFSFSDAASSSSSASDLDLGPQPPSPSAHDPSWSDSDSASSEDSEADSDSEEVDNDDGSEYSFSSHSSHSSSGHLTAHPRARTRASPYPRPRSRPARSCRGLIDSMAWLIGRVGA